MEPMIVNPKRREASTPRGVALKRPGPPGGVRDTNRIVKSQAIREAALLLFLERGVEGVSVDDIMKAARMAKGSFYRYFADQTALVEDLVAPVKAMITEALDLCSKEIDSAATKETQLAAYKRVGAVLATLLVEQPGPVRLYLQESRAPAVGARRPLIDLAKLVTQYALDITRKAQEQGLVKPLPVAVAALTVVGATERLLLAVLHDEDIGNVLEVPDAVATIMLDGVRL